MFGRVDFRGERELFGGCLVGRGKRKMMMGPVVLPRLTKKFSPQDGEKIA